MIFLSFKAVGKEITHGLFFALKETAWMNIVLIGYRCSGKTHVGKMLAGDLRMAFLDTDRLIEEKTGMPIPVYVSLTGWRNFRCIERRVVQEIGNRDNSVIATGGGVVTDPENLIALKKNGWLVWLAAGPAVIRTRMALALGRGEDRPPLSGTDPVKEIDSMLRERTPLYERASDFRVQTDGMSPEAVVQAIVQARWRTRPNCRRGTH